MNFFRVAGRLSGVALVLAMSLGCNPGFAQQVIQSAGQALQVEVSKGINAETARFGDPFEAVLKNTYQYGNRQLPAGTVLKGQVQTAHESWPFALPGYVVLDVREAQFPSGATYRFQEDGSPVRTDKLKHEKARTPKRLVNSALPFTLISAIDAVPLKYAAGFSTWQILPISLAARVALGTALEKTKSEKQMHAAKNHPIQTRYGHGVLRGTGLTGLYYLLKPSPEPNMATGATVPLRFEQKQLESLFQAGEQISEVPAPIESEAQTFSAVYGKVGKSAAVKEEGKSGHPVPDQAPSPVEAGKAAE